MSQHPSIASIVSRNILLLQTWLNKQCDLRLGKIWLRELFAPKLLNSNSIPVCVFGNVHPLCATSVGLIRLPGARSHTPHKTKPKPRRAMQRSSLSNGMEKCWRANGFEKCWRASGNDRRCICPTLDDQCICVSLCRACCWCYAKAKPRRHIRRALRQAQSSTTRVDSFVRSFVCSFVRSFVRAFVRSLLTENSTF